MFNRREQVALLFLTGALLTGTGLAVVDYYRPSSLEEFAVVPRAIPVPQPVAVALVDSGRVALNAATLEQLQQLPSIGPRMAARILQYRQENGPFESLDQLRRVRGIGARVLEKLRPLVALD
jgi:competence protein ComEA